MSRKITIAVDFMGDDPFEVVEGANEAAHYAGQDERIMVVGPKRIKRKVLCAEFQEAEGFIGMGEGLGVLRKKPNASINVACKMVKEGKADAVVSAGNTTATVGAAWSILGPIPGIERPAIAVLLPSKSGQTILLDAGATVDPKPEWLFSWARLGLVYAQISLGKRKPKVGLLSIGREKSKGNQLTKICFSLFKQGLGRNFIGNVESIFLGDADVVVCDGFVGNLLLKNLEDGITLFTKGKYEETDYAYHGGALLLGINGIVVIAHGKSSAKAIENAIEIAIQAARVKIIETIGRTLV